MTTFLLIRHGMTDAVGRYLAGLQPGVPLDATGRGEVQRLAERLQGVPLTLIASSPLERARETADAIARPRGMEVRIVDEVHEVDFGEWTGATFASLHGDAAWQRYNAVRSMSRAPRGEAMVDVQQRAVRALRTLAGEFPDGTIAVVSHGDVIRAALLYCLGMPIDFYSRLDIAPARISIVEFSEGAPRVRQVNGDTATLLA